jgi:hypothetical protein
MFGVKKLFSDEQIVACCLGALQVMRYSSFDWCRLRCAPHLAPRNGSPSSLQLLDC